MPDASYGDEDLALFTDLERAARELGLGIGFYRDALAGGEEG